MKSSEPTTGVLLRLNALGYGVVEHNETVLHFPVKKTLALVAYLMLEGKITRSKLADLFWSDNTDEDARRNLRRELHRLREAGLRDRLETIGEQIFLTEPLDSDVKQFEFALEHHEIEKALALWHGKLLEGLELPGATGFHDWVEARREKLSQLRRRAMLELAERLETRGDWRKALEFHLELLQEDQLQERTHREVMRLHDLLGEREAALEQFERCRLRLEDELGLEPLPETLLLAERIRTARAPETLEVVVQPFSTRIFQAPLVARAAELKQLRTSQAALFLIVGEPGVGKSRLAEEFASSFNSSLTVRFSQISQQSPFSAVAEAIRLALNEAIKFERLDKLEMVWKRELTRLVPEIDLSLEPPEPVSAEGRSRFLEALSQAISALASVVVFDDLHWADASSLEWIAQFSRRATQQPATSPRLIATARIQELEDEPLHLQTINDLERQGRLERLLLAALSDRGVLDLVGALSGNSDAFLFARRLFDGTAGNPFFVLETIRYLFETKSLQLENDGTWSTPFDQTTSDYTELPIPPSVRQAVLKRVNHLGAAANRLLETAALTDAGFTLLELQPATALSEWEGVAALENAVSAQVLTRFETGYRFNHDLTRKALEDGLSRERQRLIHQKLANSLESLDGHPARIAVHLELAGKPERALPWRIKAAQSARSVYAHREALTHYQQALEDGALPEQAFEIRLVRASILQALFDYTAAEAELQTLEQARGITDSSKQLNIAWMNLLYNLDRYPETLQKVTALLELPLLEPELALVLRYQGALLYRLGQAEEAEVSLRSAIDLAKTHAPELLAISNVDLGYLLLRQGKLEPAEALILEALRLTEPWQREHALAINAQARLALVLGQHERVVQSLEQALAIAYKIDDNNLAFNFLSNLLRVHLEQGNLDAAQIRLNEGLGRFHGLHLRAESYLTYRQSKLSYLRGDLGTALTRLRASIQMADQLLDNNQRGTRRMLLANWFTRLGDVKSSRMLCTELEQLAILNVTQLDYELAHCDIAQGNLEVAREQLETALKTEDQLPEALATVSYHLATIYNQLGKPTRSLELSQTQYPSTELETLNLSVRLAAMQQLGQSTRDLEDQAWKLLQNNPPPLEGLELCRTLTKMAKPSLAKKARLHAKKTLLELSATLEDQPALKKIFLELNHDLTNDL
jgi:DNA-binding SARP family transcriptional activator/predicted ATPase